MCYGRAAAEWQSAGVESVGNVTETIVVQARAVGHGNASP